MDGILAVKPGRNTLFLRLRTPLRYPTSKAAGDTGKLTVGVEAACTSFTAAYGADPLIKVFAVLVKVGFGCCLASNYCACDIATLSILLIAYAPTIHKHSLLVYTGNE